MEIAIGIILGCCALGAGICMGIGAVGPGIGELGSLDNYSAQLTSAKIIYTLDMFLGRLEIYPLLIVLSMIFRRNR